MGRRGKDQAAHEQREFEAQCLEGIRDAMRPARQRLRLSQQKMAERLDVSTEYYARMERGLQLPSVELLARIVDELDVKADELLGLDMVRVRTAGPAVLVDDKRLRKLLRHLRRSPPTTLRRVARILDWLAVPDIEEEPDAHTPESAVTNVPCPRCGDVPDPQCRACHGFGFVRGVA